MPDLASEILGLPWTRPSTHAWTSAGTRAAVLAWIRGYARSRSWVQHPPDGPGWAVLERFTDQGLDSAIERVPPYQPTDGVPFYQRTGDRVLVLRAICVSCRGGLRTHETSVTFPQGNETPTATVSMLLDAAAAALDAEHRRST